MEKTTHGDIVTESIAEGKPVRTLSANKFQPVDKLSNWGICGSYTVTKVNSVNGKPILAQNSEQRQKLGCEGKPETKLMSNLKSECSSASRLYNERPW